VTSAEEKAYRSAEAQVAMEVDKSNALDVLDEAEQRQQQKLLYVAVAMARSSVQCVKVVVKSIAPPVKVVVDSIIRPVCEPSGIRA